MDRPACTYLACQRGVTYLAVLIIVMLMGIMLGVTGQSWQTIMQREREEELLFRGSQIQEALNRWHNPTGTQHAATPLTDLHYLLQDPRTAGTVRHLRRLYKDPITGHDWQLIQEPGRGIVGINSPSASRPLKQDNFPEPLRDFAGKQHYNEWRFVVSGVQRPQPSPGN